MSFTSGITVTVERRTESAFGDFTTASQRPVGPCAIARTSSTEPGETPQDIVTRVATLFAPAGSDIVPADRVVLPDGSRWSVVGDVEDFVNPWSGWAPGLTVRIERVTG